MFLPEQQIQTECGWHAGESMLGAVSKQCKVQKTLKPSESMVRIGSGSDVGNTQFENVWELSSRNKSDYLWIKNVEKRGLHSSVTKAVLLQIHALPTRAIKVWRLTKDLWYPISAYFHHQSVCILFWNGLIWRRHVFYFCKLALRSLHCLEQELLHSWRDEFKPSHNTVRVHRNWMKLNSKV